MVWSLRQEAAEADSAATAWEGAAQQSSLGRGRRLTVGMQAVPVSLI